MKFILCTIAVFAVAITALHAQSLTVVDPAVQAAVNAAVAPQYAGYTSLVILSLMMLGRWIKALQNGTGIKGWFSAIWMGTNTNKSTLLLACLCMLTITSCTTDPAGNKSFLGLNSTQWLGVGQDAAKGAAQSGLISYGQRRVIIETTSGK